MIPQENYQPDVPNNIFEQMMYAYNEHKIDEAFRLALAFEEMCFKTKVKPTPQAMEMLENIKTEMDDVNFYHQKVVQPGWEVQTKKKDITVSIRTEGKTVGVLVDAFLGIEIEKFLAVIVEVDLMKNFMPFMKESEVVKNVGRNNRLCHSMNKFPFLDVRQAHFQGIGYDRMGYNKTVLVFSRSIHTRPDILKRYNHKIQLAPNSVQLDYKYFVIEYSPTGQKEGRMKLAINIDMKINLPLFLLKPVTENFGLDFYKNVLSIAKKFEGSDWEKKANERPEFYDFVRRRIKEEFPTK